MKKFIQIATAVILSVGFMGSVAGAVAGGVGCDDITINNSGNDSDQKVTCKSVVNTDIKCINNIIVGTANVQTSVSGDGDVDGNDTTGDVNTGTAVNYNGTDTTIGAECVAAAETTSPTPTPSCSEAPTSSCPAATTTPAATTAAASLPNTAASNTASIIGVSIAAAAAVVGLSRVAVATYRRIGNK